jgi:thymidylate synthase
MSCLKYCSKSVDFGNEDSEVAVITLWTKKDIVKKHLKGFRYLGQLYSGSVGISNLVRNCLYDKKIRHIIVTGSDLSKSGEALLSLFQKGMSGHNILDSNVMLEEEIPIEKIMFLQENVTIHDLRSKVFEEVREYIDGLDKQKSGSYGLPEEFPLHEIGSIQTFPSDHTGFLVKDRYISGAWLKILRKIMRFGIERPSSYHDRQKEILNLTSVIYDEDPDIPKIADFFNFSVEELKTYYGQIISSKKIDGVEYTYGMRLRDYGSIDQIDETIQKLKKDRDSRRAVAVTWDVKKDSLGNLSPCLMLVQAMIQDDRLFLTGYFRSNDMFEAWPKNAFGLRKLQYLIAREVGINAGSLTIISSSAHIYERDFERTKGTLQKYSVRNDIYDPRGNLVIWLKEKDIVVQHQSNEGNVLNEYSGQNASALFQKLAEEDVISEISHALDIGSEIQKAEIALRNNLVYHQDQKLIIRR